MIPWEKFKTPQDAYDWAKTATSTHLLAECAKTGDHLVLAATPRFMDGSTCEYRHEHSRNCPQGLMSRIEPL